LNPSQATSSLIASTYSGLLLGGIGVVEAQVALAPKLGRKSKVEADRLGMPDVQVAVRLGRKTRLHPSSVPSPVRNILGDDVTDEILDLPRASSRGAPVAFSCEPHWLRYLL
jgi:hypothetical protein